MTTRASAPFFAVPDRGVLRSCCAGRKTSGTSRFLCGLFFLGLFCVMLEVVAAPPTARRGGGFRTDESAARKRTCLIYMRLTQIPRFFAEPWFRQGQSYRAGDEGHPVLAAMRLARTSRIKPVAFEDARLQKQTERWALVRREIAPFRGIARKKRSKTVVRQRRQRVRHERN